MEYLLNRKMRKIRMSRTLKRAGTVEREWVEKGSVGGIPVTCNTERRDMGLQIYESLNVDLYVSVFLLYRAF